MKIALILILSTLLIYTAENKPLSRFMGMGYQLIEEDGKEPKLRVIVASRSKSGKYSLELLLSNDAEILSGFVTGEHGGFRSYINAALKKSLKGKHLEKGFKLDAISRATSTTKSLQSLLTRSVIKVDRLMKKLKLEPIEKLVKEKEVEPPTSGQFMGMKYQVIKEEGKETILQVIVKSRSKSGKYTLQLELSSEAEILSGIVTGEHGGFRSYINAALKKSLKGKHLEKGFKLDAISRATSTTKSLQSLLTRSVIKVNRLMKKLKLEPIEKHDQDKN